MKIIFMGTPDFAVASLDALVKADFDIVGVVTAVDKPAGRGQLLHESAIKKYAVEHGLHLLQPTNLKDKDFLTHLNKLNCDLQIVVAFRMLPQVVWDMPRLGTINLHASLLPQYRGAAPINWAIINGEKESGVSTFFLKEEIDTGDILLSERVIIADNETAGSLHDKLMTVGAQLLVNTVESIRRKDFKAQPQVALLDKHQSLKHAPKIFKNDCCINWFRSCIEVNNQIRGLNPYPTAYTWFNGKNLKIFSTEISVEHCTKMPGEWISDGKNYLKFACVDGFLSLKEVQLEGKKRMFISDFLRGLKVLKEHP